MKNLFFILTLLLPVTCQAHAFLDHAEPKVGQGVSACPKCVKVWFTEAVEPAFSTLTVVDASGTRVDQKDAHVDDADKTLMAVSLHDLPAGVYKVTWSVVASDTHHTHGDFTFTIHP